MTKRGKFLIRYYIILLLALVILWLIGLFPLNLRDPGFVVLLILVSVLAIAPYTFSVHWRNILRQEAPDGQVDADGNVRTVQFHTVRSGDPKRKLFLIPLALAGLFLIGHLTGFVPFRSKAYARLIEKETGDFGKDISELDFYDIPTIDRETAIRLGNKRMGEMADLVSQFDVAEDYTQINYRNEPVRVTPLAYNGFFKWLGNRSNGLPRLVTVNLVSGEVELIPIEGGMKYSESEPFFRNIHRHVRLRYPTAILGDAKFEIDESGVPYWIFPVEKPQVGWFGGRDVTDVILANAVSGETEKMPVADVPDWVDRVYPSEILLKQLDDNGRYQNGWFNSLFGQRGVLQITAGYNYLALDDDVYLYTGITSVAGDSSNLGFVLVNQRTKDTRFYQVSSADETSAMRSAEGAVQEKGYTSTFPILLNINGRPSYCMALKDNARLVKMYALVDAQNYQSVATGTTIKESMRNYQQLLANHALTQMDDPPEPQGEKVEKDGTVAAAVQVVVEGNTVYYLQLEGETDIYAAALTLSPELPFLTSGDKVTIRYMSGQEVPGFYVLDDIERK